MTVTRHDAHGSTDIGQRRSNARQISRDLVLVDLICVVAAVGAGVLSRQSSDAPLLSDGGRLYVVLVLLVVWPVALWARQSREPTILGAGIEEYRRVIAASAWSAGVTAAFAFFLDIQSARRLFVFVLLLGTGLLLMGRWIVRRSALRIVADGVPLTRVFLAARGSHFDAIRREIEGASPRYAIVGSYTGDELMPDPEVLVREALELGADSLVVGSSIAVDPNWTRRLGWAMEHTDLRLLLSPAIMEVAGPRLQVKPVEGLALVSVEMPRFSGGTRVIKRVIDVVGSLVGMLVLGIPLLMVALVIRRTSEGPALFKQPRAGLNGDSFLCWKFRTMVVDADAQRAVLRAEQVSGAATFKMERDPRITGIGGFLRRFSIDELPQLVNVLRGEMSLVGPRPHPFDDVELYDEVATRRLLVKPGMTGLWQVSGRSDLDWERSIMLDLYYVENWSLVLDATIVLKTFAVVIRGSGAY